ncbi:MAG TPA: DUF2235 domain-containing protein [Oceanospirillales bacterium]|nr:DUF2235 domain-containing protein [Oceanospirillales bacterium]
MVMSKNIILCSDGTGQSGGIGKNTNVWRIYDAIKFSDNDDTVKKQLAFYDDGVGTNSNIVLKIMGLAFGYGLSRNIRQLYKYLVMHYKAADAYKNSGESDDIYMFGFSRGSHTIRLLAAFICKVGILDAKSYHNEIDLDRDILKLQKLFKNGIRKQWLKNSGASFVNSIMVFLLKSIFNDDESKLKLKKQAKRTKDFKIKFIGVWDTVSAVGMPIEEMRNTILFAQHAFVDHKLDPKVERACHALAIDEMRHTFKPELWEQKTLEDHKRINQVWFSGVHANVGGGYAKDQLSLVSLNWMISEASKCGLIFRKSRITDYNSHQNVNGTLYDSRAGFSAFYRYKPRNIDDLILAMNESGQLQPQIHVSVFERIMDSSASYSPTNLANASKVTMTDYTNLLEEDAQPNARQSYCLNKLPMTDKLYQLKSEISETNNNPWNIIWWQKLLHLAFIIFFITFVTLGYQLTKLSPAIAVSADRNIVITSIQRFLIMLNDSNPLYITNKLLPGYANNWKIFTIMLLAFVLILWLRSLLRKHHKNIGNLIWNHAPFNENRVDAHRLPVNIFLAGSLKLASSIRSWNFFNKFLVPYFKNRIVPKLMNPAYWLVAYIFVLFFYGDKQ